MTNTWVQIKHFTSSSLNFTFFLPPKFFTSSSLYFNSYLPFNFTLLYSNSHVTKDTHKVLLLGFKPGKLGAPETPIMVSPNNRDLLTSFNPSSDLFVIASIDGRIKIWDAIKGHLQTELFNLPPSPNSPAILAGGHLSLNYTCMKWLHLGSKKKKKIWSSVLVLGTGHGDVLAIDMATELMKWKLCDCHSGGVSVVSFSRHNSSIYTAGVDSMVCQIDPSTGNLLSKFKASTKAISSLSISEDGKILCVASAQLKTFSCYDHKKIQRFPGHPVAVRCMIFSEDGKYILSSGVGEKYIAIWRVDAGKKGSVCCALSIEHPAVFLDSKCSNAEDTKGAGLYVLAISETGLCYVWYGSNIDDLRASKPTKISVCAQSFPSNNSKVLAIFAAKIQGILKPGAESVLIAYGSLIKPSFEKVTVENGVDLNLEASQEGVLFLKGQSYVFQTGQATQSKENLQDAEDAICLEDRLREIGILGNKKMSGIYLSTPTGTT